MKDLRPPSSLLKGEQSWSLSVANPCADSSHVVLAERGLRKIDGILRPCSAQPAGRFCSAQKFWKSSGPKAQSFIQRRAEPWYIGRTARSIVQRFAVFGPTGQEFA